MIICFAHASIAKEQSLRDSVRQNLPSNETEELQLNRDAINQIDFGNLPNSSPFIYTEKDWLLPDASLPVSLPDEIPLDKRKMLTLRPYTANTPYNWDPVRKKKIKVTKDTWRSDPYYEIRNRRIYSNWAKNTRDARVRNCIAQIEATGLRYNPLAGRVGTTVVGSWQSTSNATGLDLMTPLTKEFWDRAGRKRRQRTLVVLSQYGDSTSTLFNQPINEYIAR